MKNLLFTLASFSLLLPSCNQRPDEASAPPTVALVAAVDTEQLPVIEAAGTFADSLSALPKATPADQAAARAYVRAVTRWQQSGLKPSIKDHPCMDNTWARYRYVLRTVVTSHNYPEKSAEDAKKWESFPPQCEAVAKLMLPLIDEPDLSPSQAVGSLINVESGMGNVKYAAERYLMYLQDPRTRQ